MIGRILRFCRMDILVRLRFDGLESPTENVVGTRRVPFGKYGTRRVPATLRLANLFLRERLPKIETALPLFF